MMLYPPAPDDKKNTSDQLFQMYNNYVLKKIIMVLIFIFSPPLPPQLFSCVRPFSTYTTVSSLRFIFRVVPIKYYLTTNRNILENKCF